jgi:hypothetical protein
MRNTTDVTGHPSPSVSGVSVINPLVAFNDIHGRKGEVPFFCMYVTIQSTLYPSYFKGISANTELQVYSETCCSPFVN